MSDSQTTPENSPAQRAFAAAADTVRGDFISALDRATAARRIYREADSGSTTRENAKVALDLAVAELRTFHGEIDDQVAA